MEITVEQIDLWCKTRTENQHLEFKEAKTQFDFQKLAKYCVSIGNEGGGKFILGVNDSVPHQVVGTVAFSNYLEIESKLFQILGFRVNVEVVNHPGGRVVIFHIPSRPRGTAFNYNGSYWMRSGSSLVPMSEDQLRRIFAEGQPDWLEELSTSELSGQDVIELLDMQTYFELIKEPYPTTQESVLEKLVNERLVYKSNSFYTIKRIAAIILARNLDHFPDVVRKAPRVVVYDGISKSITKRDQRGSKGYAVGFQGLVKYIMDQLPQNETIENALRKEVKLIPDIVIRELVANALIHQDFNETGTSAMIEIYDNRFEISNPGEPIVPIERFIDGYQSRNERLANIMRRMGICEEKSSGIDKVVQTAEAYQLPAPDFRSEYKRTSVVIYGPKTFEEMSREERIRACYQHCVLKWVMSEQMTNQSLRKRFQLNENKSVNISQVISLAAEEGLIKTDSRFGGSKKFARYIPFWA